jgi:hypothetical protein
VITSETRMFHQHRGACIGAIATVILSPLAAGATSQIHVAVPADEELPALPRIVLLPEASFTLGNGAFLADEFGGTLHARMGAWAFGVRGLIAESVAQGFMSGCENTAFCVNQRVRFGPHGEYHFRSGRSIEPWVGLGLEIVAATGFPAASGSHETTRWGAVLVPEAGVDFMGRWNRGMAGAGVFAATPLGGVDGAAGLGLTLGVRIPLGFF